MSWLKRMLDAGEMPNLLTMDIEKIAMLKWGNSVEDNKGLPDIWHANVAENIPYLESIKERVKSVRELPDFEGKIAMLIGASPSLAKNWQHLKEIDDRFLIFASNSAAKFLVTNDIIPDFVTMIDGQKEEPWEMDIGEENLKTALIASPFCHPQTLRDWKGKIYILPYKIKEEKLQDVIRERYGESVAAGGNSTNCTMGYLINCSKINIYIFVGNEFSFKTKHYYVDRVSNKYDNLPYFLARDVNGDTVGTLVPLWEYKIWLENLMWELYRAGYWFCNCSEGILGVDSDGSFMPCVAQMPLDEAIKQVKNALAFEKQDEMVKCQQIYDLLYKNTAYLPINGKYTWGELLKQIDEGKIQPFTKALDVGCGAGSGIVEVLNKGYDVYGADIADNRELWGTLHIANRCFVAPAHAMPFKNNEFDFVFCCDVLEHIPLDWIDKSLKEIRRVGSDRFFWGVANRPSAAAGGAVEVHHTVAPGVWWTKKIEDAGFTIVGFNEDDHHAVIGSIKNDQA